MRNVVIHNTQVLYFFADFNTSSAQYVIHMCSQIVFEGVRGDGVYGDVAIDNLKVRSGRCSDEPGVTEPPDTGELEKTGQDTFIIIIIIIGSCIAHLTQKCSRWFTSCT